MNYIIYNDRIRIQGFPGFYFFDIKFRDIDHVEVRRGPVFRDLSRTKRILKNDLADLFEHIAVVKRTGVWREIRITPKEPRRFLDILQDAIRKGRGR